jgi:hypothetical protein
VLHKRQERVPDHPLDRTSCRTSAEETEERVRDPLVGKRIHRPNIFENKYRFARRPSLESILVIYDLQ